MILRIQDTAGLLDCEYEADLTYFTNNELHDIKVKTGLRVSEFPEAFEMGDNDLMVAMAEVILVRNGRKADVPTLWNLPAGKISFDLTEEEEAEDAAIPPTNAPEDKTQNVDEMPSTGASSDNGGGASLVTGPPLTGLQALGTSATSPPETLGT